MTRNNLLGLSLLLACAAPAVSMAQTAYLEQSGIVGAGKTISISRLPTAPASGKITYYDGTINFSVSPAGVPSVTSSSFTKSPPLVTNHFIPGRYYIKYDNAATQFGSLTEGVGRGGSTEWSLVMDTNPDGDFPDQATWQTGAPTPDVAARLAAAKVTLDPNASYGVTAVGNHLTCDYAFDLDNGLLSAKQINNDLAVSSYTNCNGDQSLSQRTVIFGLCTDKACSNAPQ